MGDEKIKSSALALIETEDDENYRNKYFGSVERCFRTNKETYTTIYKVYVFKAP